MRASVNIFVILALIFVAMLASMTVLSVFATLLAVVCILALGTFFRLRSTLKPKSDTLVLECISVSHYVEKVRWALDWLQVPYKEQHDIGILGVLLKGRTVPTLHVPEARAYLGDSKKILRYLWGNYSHKSEAQFLKPDKERLQWEEDLDVYGEHLRRWAYFHLLEEPKTCRRFWGLYEPQVPTWQRKALPFLFPFLKVALKFMLRINEKTAERSLKKVHAMFDRIDALLEDGRQTIMGGETPCFIDISFAALTGVLLMPENYGNGTIDKTRPRVEMIPDPAHSEILRLRARPAGKMVMRLYQDHRSAG